ncbi:MAG: radical SAM family RiPP maturation amino acid epimerase, partial [Cyanobacteria bacterium P01_A01_bin.83]
PNFREQWLLEPQETLVDYGIKLNSAETSPLWQSNFAEKLGREHLITKRWQHWQKLARETKPDSVLKNLIASPKNLHFKAWRERQIARANSQFQKSVRENVTHHLPLTFELSKGCSIGCSFCAISAPRLDDIFFYSQENAKLWSDVIKLLKEILGAAAGGGFCYWATDPLDNPDYEQFCSDFHRILGIFPQTTTAQPLKNPDRTRALLKLSRQKGCHHNRFSILSLKMLDRVCEEFSAEELAFVQLALQNKEANGIKARAGRAREKSLDQGTPDSELPEQGTIACVTGFLFNMVDRSVKLISPCNASDRWPDGYIIYDQGTFTNAEDLKILLERMIEDNMPLTVRPNQLMSFRPDLNYESLSDGFRLSNRIKTYSFRHEPYIKELGDLIAQGNKTAREIAAILESDGTPLALTFYHLNLIFEKGIVDEEPKLTKVLVKS